MRRIFLALDLPESHCRQLALTQMLLPLPRRVDPALFHLTLVFLEKVSDPALEALDEALAALRLPAPEVRLRGLGHFGGEKPRSVHVLADPEPALMALQAKLDTACRRSGLDPEARRFVPHVTLGRFAPPPLAEALRLERALAEGGGLALPAFVPADVGLFESLLSGKTPYYQKLASYPMRHEPREPEARP